MFRKPLALMKKFFDFKSRPKDTKPRPAKILSQKEIADAEKRDKQKKKSARIYYQKLVAQRKRVARWRAPRNGMKT